MTAGKIETVLHASWDDFTKFLRTNSHDVADYLYRGQGNPSWSLVPTLQRKLDFPISSRKIYEDRKYQYLRAFRDHAHGLIGFPDGLATLDKLLSLGRHHGLVTPVLDWARSPYIAAFFALVEVAAKANMPLDRDPDTTRGRGGKETVAIWRYQITGDGSIGTELQIFTEVGFPNIRQKAQSSVYMHLDTHEYRSIDDLMIDKGKERNLQKWLVIVEDVRETIADLALMNIHLASMFPDLSHAAQHANNRVNYPESFF